MSLVLTDSPEQLRKNFNALSRPQDVAPLLDVDHKHLNYHLYISSPSSRYYEFVITKPSGGARRILAPISAIKIIQRKLLQVLEVVYKPKTSTQGFVEGRSIVMNASPHTRKRNVLNVDLADFFPSINFGRVRGMFMAVPYGLNDRVATVLAQICCFQNQLPQGAPTSPIVSNMICARLDSELRRLAVENRCSYTRYSDDITFSITVRRFPGSIAGILPSGNVETGSDLQEVIESNGFSINREKVRLQTQFQRQEVTGLVVNEFPNVRRKLIRHVRAMLHDWRVNGLEAAQTHHKASSTVTHESPFKPEPSFKRTLKGKIDFIGMVRGQQDRIYLRYLYEYAVLDPDYEPPPLFEAPPDDDLVHVTVFTEGKTDWRHLTAALNGLQEAGHFGNLAVQFNQRDDDMGGPELVRMCRNYSMAPEDYLVPLVFIFDRDDHNVLQDAHLKEDDFHDWGRNVYSVALPVPEHRTDTPEICIELLYDDDEITTPDENGWRLFLSLEFSPDSGRHRTEDLVYVHQGRLKPNRLMVLDDDVLDPSDKNVALPKIRFANYVLNRDKGFEGFDFSVFVDLFELIVQIGSDG